MLDESHELDELDRFLQTVDATVIDNDGPSQSFGDGVVSWRVRGPVLRATRDRGQWFIDIRTSRLRGKWIDIRSLKAVIESSDLEMLTIDQQIAYVNRFWDHIELAMTPPELKLTIEKANQVTKSARKRFTDG